MRAKAVAPELFFVLSLEDFYATGFCAQGDDGAAFDVVVSNAAGSVTSASVALSVTAPLPPVAQSNAPASAIEPSPAAGIAARTNGGSALDMVEAGGRVAEADESNSSVGYGGLPDRDGRVTLDACVMTWAGDIGAVARTATNSIAGARRTGSAGIRSGISIPGVRAGLCSR